MQRLDEYRSKKGEVKLNIEYAYLGITDDCCYDLRSDRRLKNDIILDNGIDTVIKPVDNVDLIWDRVKLGSKFPFVLKVRLSDNARFLGNFVITDLLTTRFVASSTRTKDGYAFHESCSRLRETVRLIATSNHMGLIPSDACVLTKALAQYLSGMSRMNAFIHVEEYPETALEETLSALDFAQHLQQITCRSLRNVVDLRVADSGSKAEYYKDRFYRAQALVNKMETRCEELQSELQESKKTLQSTSNLEADIKHDLENSATINAELQSRNRSLELETEYLKHHVELFKAEFQDQIRQLQTEAGMLKHSQRRAICEAEDLEEEVKEKEQIIMELTATLKTRAQQVEDLEIFQKQAKLLLNENDGKYAKMVRFYERKEADFMEQMQHEKFKWSEKRSIMQSKIDNLQHELEKSRDQNFKAQQDKMNWISNQEKLQAQLTQLMEEAKAATTRSNSVAGDNMNAAVTIQDISNLRFELERQAKELEGYKAQINPVETTTGGKSAREQREIPQTTSELPSYAKQHEVPELEHVQHSIAQASQMQGSDTEDSAPVMVAKENIQPTVVNQQDRSNESAPKINKDKEKADKSSNKRAKISSSQVKYTSTESQTTATKSIALETTTDNAPPPASTKTKQAGNVHEPTTDAFQDNVGRARVLSPELLVYPTPKQTEPLSAAIASTGAKPTKAINPTKTPLQEESTAKSSRKKRKLGSRKTITAEEQKALIEFKIIPEE
ncbi:hypothetical protein INT43_003389 [Umbelopsis isabellina]|uniref:Uncharacterized protein n=1 Tax=Mortierella isabellina TaxID=91625 RepID=A0A8H7PQB9_MORIS|nr:hypothetical protein INT43_003389 [Umbelopsis isabellina]